MTATPSPDQMDSTSDYVLRLFALNNHSTCKCAQYSTVLQCLGNQALHWRVGGLQLLGPWMVPTPLHILKLYMYMYTLTRMYQQYRHLYYVYVAPFSTKSGLISNKANAFKIVRTIQTLYSQHLRCVLSLFEQHANHVPLDSFLAVRVVQLMSFHTQSHCEAFFVRIHRSRYWLLVLQPLNSRVYFEIPVGVTISPALSRSLYTHVRAFMNCYGAFSLASSSRRCGYSFDICLSTKKKPSRRKGEARLATSNVYTWQYCLSVH